MKLSKVLIAVAGLALLLAYFLHPEEEKQNVVFRTEPEPEPEPKITVMKPQSPVVKKEEFQDAQIIE